MGRYPSLAGCDDRPFDVSILTLKLFGEPVAEIEDFRRWFFELNVATPQRGTHVVAYGFTKTRLEQNPSDSLAYTLTHSFRRVEGTITAVHFPMRDQAGMPFPCFEVDADFEPGMSGGPVFNDRGQVCGVISRGGGFSVSWASVLWPAFGISVDGKTGLQLAREGIIRARNHHCVQLRFSPEEKFPDVSFDPTHELP